MLNKKHMIIFLALLVACMSIAVAADTADTTTADSQVSDTIEADTTNTIQTQATTNANEDNNKITKENKNIKEDTTSTINIDDDNFDYEKQQKTENKENIIKTTNNENKSLKTTGEPTVINITEENYAEWFKLDDAKRLKFVSGSNGAKTFYIEYLPTNITMLDLYTWYSTSWDTSQYTFIGKNNFNLTNVKLRAWGANVLISNMTLYYDEDYENSGDSFSYYIFIESDYDFVPGSSFVLDNIKINYTGKYLENYHAGVLCTGENQPGVTYQNFEINAKMLSVPDGNELIILERNDKFINSTVNIVENYATADETSITGIKVNSKSVTIKDNNITMNGESTLTAIKLNSNNNTITNNNITVTTTGTATGVELTGNDNTVTDNYIVANDKKGDNAVTATGENNIVENNTAVEMDTRIPTSIELNYDGTPIDVGQQLVIRGAFKAGNDETGAENIKVYDNNELITTINTIDEFGTITYAYIPTVSGSHNITFAFEGNDTCKNTSTTITVEVNEVIEPTKEYTLKVDTTEFTQGQTTTITASIYYGDENEQEIATNISKGKISFKVNGKTLKDVNGKVIYAKVINGTATIENYPIPESWKEGSTIQAIYSGSTDLEKMSSEKTEITITATEPTITTEDITAQTGATITLKATINTDATINTGKVVFKINGKTLKDTNGKVIYTKVVNNEVTVEYTLPEEYTTGTYNITAVFISPDYERLEDTKTLTVTA